MKKHITLAVSYTIVTKNGEHINHSQRSSGLNETVIYKSLSAQIERDLHGMKAADIAVAFVTVGTNYNTYNGDEVFEMFVG